MSTRKDKFEVSVVIPCYNGEKFIYGAIESVLNQSYQNFEIIIVDDGSTDNSKSVIQPFLRDQRIRLVEHGQNKGIPAARNTGIKASKGRFVAFLDQDDLWLPEKLDKQIAIFEKGSGNVGLVFSKMVIVLITGRLNKRYLSAQVAPSRINQLSKQEVLKALFMNNFVPMITTMVRRECMDTVGLFDERIRGGADDYDFCLRLATRYAVQYIDMPLAVRQIHFANYSNPERFFEDELLIIDKMVEQTPLLAKLRNKKLGMIYYNLGRYYQLNEKIHYARSAILKAIKYHPFKIKPFLALMISFLGSWGNSLSRIYRSLKAG